MTFSSVVWAPFPTSARIPINHRRCHSRLVVAVWGAVILAVAQAGCAGSKPTPEPGVLEVGENRQTSAFTRNFNPLLEVGDLRWPTKVAMYETLLVFNPMKSQFVPWLATDWKFSDDRLTLTFTTRQGVLWSDGKPFTARDVEFTFALLKKFPALDIYGFWQYLKAVRADGDGKLVMEFSRQYVPGLDDITVQFIVPQHIWKDVADPVSFANENPVATGPFTEITSFQPQAYRVERNRRYWGGEPAVKALYFRAYAANDQTIMAIINGEIDWSGNFIPAVQRIHVGRDPENHHYWFPALDATVVLYANATVDPYKDVRVRKALSMAIDRQRVVMVAMHNYTHPSDATALSDSHKRFHDDKVAEAEKDWVTFNPEAAGRLLDEVGLRRGPDGWRRKPDGTPWTVPIMAPIGFSDWVVAAQIITKGFRKIGIDANLRTLDYAAWYDEVQRGEFQVSMGWTLPSNTPYGFYRGLMSKRLMKPIGEEANENWHRLAIPETDEIFAKLDVAVSFDEQLPLYHQLQALFAKYAPVIPLFPGPLWGLYNSKRFTGFPSADDPYAPLSPHLYPTAILVLTKLRPK